MEKINCNVIQDILTLYIEDTVSEDTKKLVEAHLQNCEICRQVYQETKTDLENDIKISMQTKNSNNKANDLKSFRKSFIKRKIKTILFSIAATVIFFVSVFIFMNKHVTYINYKELGITIIADNEDEVKYKTTIKGNYHWKTSLDSETGIGTIHFEQSLWEKYIDSIFYSFDHIHGILKKDMIAEMYVNKDGTTATIWEASEAEKKAYFSENHTTPLG